MTYLQSAVTVATWRDYVQLCKPRVVLLMLLTAIVGMCLAAPGVPPLDLVAAGIVGIALVAGSAAVVNHVADAHVDQTMKRTQARPVAQGRIAPPQALLFSGLLGLTGMLVLTLLVNPLTALLNLISWVGYGLIYTLYLKHRTPQNIVIGGLFGAAPPLFGWTAITGTISVEPLLLVLIIFVWTPPHFWALALARLDDYRDAGVPMLPITHGVIYTRRSVMAYTALLAVVSALPVVVGMAGLVYLGVVLVLNLRFLYWARKVLVGDCVAPMKTFRYSIFYLGVLFLALLLDHYLILVTSLV